MVKSYVLLFFLLSAPLYGMEEEKSSEEYASKVVEDANKQLVELAQENDPNKKLAKWFKMLLALGKLQACDDLKMLDKQSQELIKTGTTSIEKSFIDSVKLDKKATALDAIRLIAEELGKSDKTASEESNKKLERSE